MGSIEFKIWILMIVIILILLLIILYRINVSDECQIVGSIDSMKLDTGDLLFVSYKNSLGYFMRTWSKSKWSHIAMAYKTENNQIFVMETANYPDRKGVLFLSIGEWYRYNKNCEISVMKLNKPNNFNSDKIIKTFEDICDKKLDTFGTSWLRLITKKNYDNNKLNHNITCYEMVVHILQESDIVKKKYSPSSYFPIDIIENRLELNTGFKYDKLTKFKI